MLNFKKSYLWINARDPKFVLWFCLRGVLRLCGKIMGKIFRAVFCNIDSWNNIAWNINVMHVLTEHLADRDI